MSSDKQKRKVILLTDENIVAPTNARPTLRFNEGLGNKIEVGQANKG